jgi:putative aminopeptidase FrvX
MLKSTDAFLPGERLLIQPECKCKGEKLYGWQVSSIAILHLAISLIKACKLTQNPISIAFVNETLAGEEETLHLIANQNPKQIVVCSTAAEHESFSVGGGPALVLKDGNGVITADFRQGMEEAAQGCGLTLSYFIGNEDVAFAKMYLSAKKHHFGGLYLSVKEKSSGFEEISLQDVEKTRSLLLKYLSNFAIINK